MPGFIETVWLVARKDLVIEVRSREILYTTTFFAVACVLVFAFGFVREGEAIEGRRRESSGSRLLFRAHWRSAARSSGNGRTKRSARCCIAPVQRPAIYIGKLTGILLVARDGRAPRRPAGRVDVSGAAARAPGLLMGLLTAGTIGFAAVGTLFAAMLVRARSRDVLLPVLLYPITIPVIIAGVRGTAALIQPEVDLQMARAWLSMLVFFDVVFITLALWTFEPVMADSVAM